LPGLTRQFILFARISCEVMDLRVKPAGDDCGWGEQRIENDQKYH